MNLAYPQRIAAKVGQLLIEQGKTQTDLAAALNVTQTQISRRLNGKNDFPLRDLPALAAFFGVPIAELTDRAPAA